MKEKMLKRFGKKYLNVGKKYQPRIQSLGVNGL